MSYNPRVDFDLQLRAAVYRFFADRGQAPTLGEMCRAMRTPPADVKAAYARLQGSRMLVLMEDGESIRMALPFSGIPTQHRVRARGKEYFANCAWDAFGIPAALRADADVLSRCEQSGDALHARITQDGAGSDLPASWRFHAAVPAVHWWRDIVYT
jgi:Alkylmercury lyase